MNGAVHLSAGQLGLAALLVLAVAAVSGSLQLGLGKRLLLVCLRAVLQLALLGLLLDWIFGLESPIAVLAWVLFAVSVAAFEAVRRTSRTIRGMVPATGVALLASCLLVSTWALAVVIRAEPWWMPRYAIPIVGMVLGNTLNGIALGLGTALDGFVAERDRVELLLAHGATPREASREVVRTAVRTGLLPILNMIAIAGLVSIPGMMTGQILAGEDPLAAARYQLTVLFCIAGGTALGTLSVVLAVERLVFDERGRLRLDRIAVRGERAARGS
jgi:putative ABC transport system permease protein